MLKWIASLGRRDFPTDGVEDYCVYLSRALTKRGVELQLVRVPWAEKGWFYALRWLWQEARAWQGRWVLVQYTALSWSRRGFPIGLLPVLEILRGRKCRLGIVYHDASGYIGHRLIDRLRRRVQHQVMRLACQWVERAISPVPLEALDWLPVSERRKVFVIPVGPNIPEGTGEARWDREEKVVAVFGVTGGRNTSKEVADIAFVTHQAVKRLQSEGRKLQLIVFGRGSKEAETALRQSVNSNISLSVLGLLPAEEITRTLSQADALLFVRGHVSGRRGSAIAGIACGLPVVGYSGKETGFPITEAGILLVPQGDREALAEALTRVLTDANLWWELHQRSKEAYRLYFSWDAIAKCFLEVLDGCKETNIES
jgi:glycosyltransferase involved in cell wall biosynthesis